LYRVAVRTSEKGCGVMQSRPKQKLERRSKYAAQFDALRDSIEGDPTQEEIAELAAIIKDENCERDEILSEEQKFRQPRTFKLNLGDRCE
jgi:hypothetical protein